MLQNDKSRSIIKLNLHNVAAYLLTARTLKPAETAVARERLRKHIVSAAKREHATMEELLEMVFSVWFVLKVYKESASYFFQIIRLH
jgi:hypothetical protein